MSLLLAGFHTLTKTETLKILTGIVLVFGCAQISIPLEPVPITLHTFAVLLIGLTYTPREAFRTLGGYLVLGGLGVPVFAHYHGGLVYLFGKTGGYLFGFLAAVTIMALIQERLKTRNLINAFFLCMMGHVIIYAMGIAWLATFIGMQNAISYGLLPFIIPGIVKAVFLSGTLNCIHYFQRRA